MTGPTGNLIRDQALLGVTLPTRKSSISNADESLFLMIQQFCTWGHQGCPRGSFFLRLLFGSNHASNNS